MFERTIHVRNRNKLISSTSSHSKTKESTLFYGKYNDDKEIKNEMKTTPIEDGSPLGVGIVIIGGSLVVFGEQDIPVWVVFATASIAAGISRLIRNR